MLGCGAPGCTGHLKLLSGGGWGMAGGDFEGNLFEDLEDS